MRDPINCEHTLIAKLLGKLFQPTLLGMLLVPTINIADGVFVDRDTGLHHQVSQTLRLSLACGLLITCGDMLFSPHIVFLFLPPTASASCIATAELPYFSIACILFTVNIVCIGYYQSMERFGRATMLMLLRGVPFWVPAFCFFHFFIGTIGLWLAVPLSEALILLTIVMMIQSK